LALETAAAGAADAKVGDPSHSSTVCTKWYDTDTAFTLARRTGTVLLAVLV
jgi:hypothetical protein